MRDYDYSYDYYPERPGTYETREVYLFSGPQGPELYPPPDKKKFEFSSVEIQQIAVAYLVLVACFSIVFSTGFGGLLGGLDMGFFIAVALPVSLIAVGLGFILHELAHKFTAQHYGFWSEFRYDQRGLLFALLLSVFIGFVWAAPGATWISGRISKRQNGIISLAGPATNMAIAGIIVPIVLVIPISIISVYLWFSGWIIAFLAVFNLIPISPLDGSKVVRWNVGIYILSMIGAVALLAFYWIGL
jgi:Zn-dependent protease